MAHVRDAFRDKCASSRACLGETASSSFGVRPRHGCEIDAKGFCQSAMRRQLLSTMQASPRNVFGQCLDDAAVNRTLAVAECRGQPIQYLPLEYFCMRFWRLAYAYM